MRLGMVLWPAGAFKSLTGVIGHGLFIGLADAPR